MKPYISLLLLTLVLCGCGLTPAPTYDLLITQPDTGIILAQIWCIDMATAKAFIWEFSQEWEINPDDVEYWII